MIHDLRHFAFLADVIFQIFLSESELIHAEAYGLDGIGIADGVVFLFVLFDEQGPEFEFRLLFGSGFGIHQGFHVSERLLMHFLVFDDGWFHGWIRWLRR